MRFEDSDGLTLNIHRGDRLGTCFREQPGSSLCFPNPFHSQYKQDDRRTNLNDAFPISVHLVGSATLIIFSPRYNCGDGKDANLSKTVAYFVFGPCDILLPLYTEGPKRLFKQRL